MFEVLFFSNGNTAFLKNGKQEPKLQESWLMLYVKFLEEKGIDPLEGTYALPDGIAKIFKTDSGYNWRFLSRS